MCTARDRTCTCHPEAVLQQVDSRRIALRWPGMQPRVSTRGWSFKIVLSGCLLRFSLSKTYFIAIFCLPLVPEPTVSGALASFLLHQETEALVAQWTNSMTETTPVPATAGLVRRPVHTAGLKDTTRRQAVVNDYRTCKIDRCTLFREGRRQAESMLHTISVHTTQPP